jgi:hypothetical protein
MATMNRRLFGRTVALAAAYAMALNALLPALAGMLPPAASGAPGMAVICSASGPASPAESGAPVKPQPLCPHDAGCAIPACANLALQADDRAAAGTARLSAAPAGLTQDSGSPRTFRLGHANFARGPPAA